VWLPPGATVPSTYDTDPFVLEARELRGAVSNGMLASPKELAISDSHEGLLLLDGDIVPGTSFNDAYAMDDRIIDIENKMFTHRPDCFGQLGVAREVAGILGKQFTSPEWYTRPAQIAAGEGLPLTVQNDIPAEVPRFMALTLKNITIKPSPVWLQTRLSRVGVRPINNVVDITNYMMLVTGQPLHAYDYDKVAALSDGDGAYITVRYPHADEQLTLLSGKTITPREQAIMIATNKQAIGLGGVMGGGNTEVDESTTNVILECASFDMYSIRRTSMAHGLFTDAVTRFNKGQSPLQNAAVLAESVRMLQEHADAQAAGAVIDNYPIPAEQSSVEVTAAFVNERLGLSLTNEQMSQLLSNVEFTVAGNNALTITPPFWRTDIEQAEDIVEEVGRLYGFDKLPLELPTRDITPTPQDALLQQKSAIRAALVKAGANEVLTYSFVHGNLLNKVGQNAQQAFSLSNALSPDLQYYRFSATPSLLDKVHANIKAGYDAFALFELGKGHSLEHSDDDEGDVPLESEYLDLVYASKTEQSGAAYYQARNYLDALAASLGISLRYEPIESPVGDPVAAPYDHKRSALAYADDAVIGIVGEYKQSVAKALKLPRYTAGFTVGQKELLAAQSTQPSQYQSLPRFPKVEQDICLKVPADVQFGALEAAVRTTLETQKPDHTRLTMSLLDIYQREDDAAHKQVTFRVGLASYEKTMTDTEMTEVLQAVADQAKQTFSAERV
jgi:phenylalanyl-tRNA synthetase beta chain